MLPVYLYRHVHSAPGLQNSACKGCIVSYALLRVRTRLVDLRCCRFLGINQRNALKFHTAFLQFINHGLRRCKFVCMLFWFFICYNYWEPHLLQSVCIKITFVLLVIFPCCLPWIYFHCCLNSLLLWNSNYVLYFQSTPYCKRLGFTIVQVR